MTSRVILKKRWRISFLIHCYCMLKSAIFEIKTLHLHLSIDYVINRIPNSFTMFTRFIYILYPTAFVMYPLFVLFSKLIGAATVVTDSELAKLAQLLWNTDVNKDVNVNVNIQGFSRQGADNARNPLFGKVDSKTLQKDTYKTFIALLDNYDPEGLRAEDSTRSEQAEIDAFINAIGKTAVVKETHKFLLRKGLAPKSFQSFMQNMKKIWFSMYPPDKNHKNILASSGFEHVFLGEIKRKKLVGLHNWVAFYIKEKAGALDYTGHKKTLLTSRPVSSMILGSSPELEMSLYSLCFYARPNANCNIPIDGLNLVVQSFVLRNRGRELVATAFPKLLRKN
ncbi:Poly(U)-specific endoribonuclease [Nymphon striatum]|nr:Poly(U)-specific endoribonuclease [Nymphon striatum]